MSREAHVRFCERVRGKFLCPTHLKMRYYDPKTGRFLQPDPIGYDDGLNLYRFVGNNPNNFSDPLGLAADGSTMVPDTTAPLAAIDMYRMILSSPGWINPDAKYFIEAYVNWTPDSDFLEPVRSLNDGIYLDYQLNYQLTESFWKANKSTLRYDAIRYAQKFLQSGGKKVNLVQKLGGVPTVLNNVLPPDPFIMGREKGKTLGMVVDLSYQSGENEYEIFRVFSKAVYDTGLVSGNLEGYYPRYSGGEYQQSYDFVLDGKTYHYHPVFVLISGSVISAQSIKLDWAPAV